MRLWIATAMAIALSATLPAAGQDAPVELAYRGEAGRVFSHLHSSDADILITAGGNRQRDRLSFRSRVDVQTMSVEPDSTLQIRLTERNREATSQGRTTQARDMIVNLRIRPDGRVVDRREAAYPTSTLLGIILPPRPVQVGDAWEHTEAATVQGVEAQILERVTLQSLAEEGAIAKLTSSQTGRVINASFPNLPRGVTVRLVDSRISGSTEWDWNVRRGEPVRGRGELTIDLALQLRAGTETVPMTSQVRVTAVIEPVDGASP